MRIRPFAALAAAAAALLVLAGCAAGTPAASGGAASADSSFPVTIRHAFGSTTIASAPKRVVTLGWGSGDAAIALGVDPVAIPFDSYAGDKDGVLPWIRDALEKKGAKLPTMLPASSDDPPYAQIAAAKPDVILAVYSGITKEQYALLTKIAPVVAYPDQAWSTPWRDIITTVGTALGRQGRAKSVLTGIDEKLAAAKKANPQFEGKTIAAVVDSAGTFYVYKKNDPRVSLLTDLGFTVAPAVDELANGDQTFFYTLSYERLDQLKSDTLLVYAGTQADADAFRNSPQDAAIPAVKAGRYATIVGTAKVSAVSPPTALSLPWGLDDLVSGLAGAVSK
ncbi:MAG: iron-siderophore ABC transporter substrate-binding protein [Micrococcales bacterium]|nr:iron-siderophore ABC transporter substrate-binding protein [Micrococcales bacterium]